MTARRQQLMHRALALHFMLQLSLVEDAEPRLSRRGMGRIHHRILFFATGSPGITISELLSVLKVRHQNIQSILRELRDDGHILVRSSRTDGRIKHLYASQKGKKLLQSLSAAQYKRIGRAYDRVTSQDVKGYLTVMAAMLGPERRSWADRLNGKYRPKGG